MKDNLGHRITYLLDKPGEELKLATGVVVDYSADGMEVHIRNDAAGQEAGAPGELVKFPVGLLLVKQFHGKVEIPRLAGTLAPPKEPTAEELHEASRVKAPKASRARIEREGNRPPPDHGAAAAGPNEFADATRT